MSARYFRHFKRMSNWDKEKLWTEKKILTPHKYYGIFKMFDNNLIGAYGGGNQKTVKEYEPRIRKFLLKYPHARNIENLSAMNPENYVGSSPDPMSKFLFRQDRFMQEGFSEEKAFELAEKDMGEEIQAEKYERSLFEGLATSNRTRTLMTVYEQKAEYESRQKLKQLERDSDAFKRYQADLEEKYADILNETEPNHEDTQNSSSVSKKDEKIGKKLPVYEPATYRTSAMTDEGNRESDILKKFGERSEMIMKFFHSFADIKDGISKLSDREIILKANETPQKLKDSFNRLLKKLEKYDITLNDQGRIDYESIKDKNALTWIKNNERMITTCLMCKDLDFEIPHKIKKEDIKEKLIGDIMSEEKRLNDYNTEQMQIENDAKSRIKSKSKGYENYFNILPNYNTDILSGEKEKLSEGAGRNMKKHMQYEEFVKQFSNKYMFDNDLLYETYYYWEDLDEKESRLRELWINSKKVKLERAIKYPRLHMKDLDRLNDEIGELVRNLRRKIDQALLKNRKHPIFGSNYRYYKRDEFTLDSEVEFHKIKKFLGLTPDVIKKDPEIGVKYDELKNLLKRKVVK